MADSNFPPILDPKPPEFNLPELDTSKMRIGNLLAQGKSARVYGVTIPDKHNEDGHTEDNDTYKPYVLKMLHNEEPFIREKAAYERMEEIPALLDGFVPRYYGTAQTPYSNIMHSIILSAHDSAHDSAHNEMKLENIISNITLETLHYVKKLLTQAIQKLHEAGIYHGKVTSKNIFISGQQGHELTLINFCDATLKKDVEDSDVEEMEDIDLSCVGEIFDEVIWAKAHEKVTNLLRDLRNGHQVQNPQYCLAELLDMIGSPDLELVRSIIELYTVPDPVLALPVGKSLANRYKHRQAIEILKQSADTFEQLSPPSDQQTLEMVTVSEMKMAVARYTARISPGSKEENLKSTKSHYDEAIRFYLRSIPNANLADKIAMTLRRELAKYYSRFDFYKDAMDLCIQAMTDANNAGREVSLDAWRDYGELIEETKKTLSHLINDIKEDKLKGVERSWRPWADLPTFEEAYRRAVDATELCNQQWDSHRMTKLAATLQVIPSTGQGMMSGLRKDSVIEDYL
ncbi:hypothetical protein BFW01_g10191 [Lasiodiplodia theobromae]|uniref:Protein kinase domain-containing protein n=1 Tax=Lasiodiplodia theobromae TaxID=45133 RepID=A0A8H7M9L9_9PEZI|nr:hypothetical protein BFW01_g10191 [Lasiodiplodia theobromae]